MRFPALCLCSGAVVARDALGASERLAGWLVVDAMPLVTLSPVDWAD